MRAYVGILTLLGLLGLLAASPAAIGAEDTAQAWQRDCAAYVKILSGESGGDDLDVTFCVGQTRGLIAGLQTGSRIGAVSMASTLALTLNLDREAVFQIFSNTSTEALLGICMPQGLKTSDHVLAVTGYLDTHPDKLALPVTAVFFEALQAAHPCQDE